MLIFVLTYLLELILAGPSYKNTYPSTWMQLVCIQKCLDYLKHCLKRE